MRTAIVILLLMGILACVAMRRSPPYAASLFCSPGAIYRLNQTISHNKEQYSGSAVHQESQSRRWVDQINAAGCQKDFGKSVLIKLKDNRALLVTASVCAEARAALNKAGRVDVHKMCGSKLSRLTPDGDWTPDKLPDAELVNDADHPSSYQHVWFGIPTSSGDVFTDVAATAERGSDQPADEIDRQAPALRHTFFEDSPGWITPYEKKPYIYKARLSGCHSWATCSGPQWIRKPPSE